jgi:hypothetical protein
MEWNRESVATAIVGTGGAWLLGSAVLRNRAGRWNSAQRRGLALSGTGFLLSAAAARFLQDAGRFGIAVSLLGTALAMIGMYALVKERAARRAEDESRLRK